MCVKGSIHHCITFWVSITSGSPGHVQPTQTPSPPATAARHPLTCLCVRAEKISSKHKLMQCAWVRFSSVCVWRERCPAGWHKQYSSSLLSQPQSPVRQKNLTADCWGLFKDFVYISQFNYFIQLLLLLICKLSYMMSNISSVFFTLCYHAFSKIWNFFLNYLLCCHFFHYKHIFKKT